MNYRLRIVIVDPVGGEPVAAYEGSDASAADSAYNQAASDRKNAAVRMFVYPSHTRIRKPVQELPAVEEAEPTTGSETGTIVPPGTQSQESQPEVPEQQPETTPAPEAPAVVEQVAEAQPAAEEPAPFFAPTAVAEPEPAAAVPEPVTTPEPVTAPEQKPKRTTRKKAEQK